ATRAAVARNGGRRNRAARGRPARIRRDRGPLRAGGASRARRGGILRRLRGGRQGASGSRDAAGGGRDHLRLAALFLAPALLGETAPARALADGWPLLLYLGIGP